MNTFLEAWLIAWLFWTGLAFGALANRLLQGLTGGEWTKAVRRPCEAAALTLPLMAVLFLPIAIGAGALYPWGNRELFAHHDWPHKAAYLTVAGFNWRTAGTLGVCMLFAGLVLRATRHRTSVCSGGLIAFFLCMNFASTDWVMSLTPRFYSTIFPAIFMSSNFLAALAFVVLYVCLTEGPALSAKQCNDLGNLLLAFIVFWAYVSVSQLILIWSGNLPREISWYLARWSGGWEWFGMALFIGQFALPFALLLGKQGKRNPRSLAAIAAIVLCAAALEVFWLVAPSIHPRDLTVSWVVPIVFVLMGALWFTAYRWLHIRVPGWRGREAAHD
jgi:hypothetical protein